MFSLSADYSSRAAVQKEHFAKSYDISSDVLNIDRSLISPPEPKEVEELNIKLADLLTNVVRGDIFCLHRYFDWTLVSGEVRKIKAIMPELIYDGSQLVPLASLYVRRIEVNLPNEGYREEVIATKSRTETVLRIVVPPTEFNDLPFYTWRYTRMDNVLVDSRDWFLTVNNEKVIVRVGKEYIPLTFDNPDDLYFLEDFPREKLLLRIMEADSDEIDIHRGESHGHSEWSYQPSLYFHV